MEGQQQPQSLATHFAQQRNEAKLPEADLVLGRLRRRVVRRRQRVGLVVVALLAGVSFWAWLGPDQQAEPAPLAQSPEKQIKVEPDKPLAPEEGNGDTPAPLPQSMTREELLAFVAKHAPSRGVVNKTPDALVLAFEGIKSAQEAQFLNQLEVALEGWDEVTFTIQAGRFVGPQRFIRWNQEGQHYEP